MPSIPCHRLLDIHVVETVRTERNGQPVTEGDVRLVAAVKPDTPMLQLLRRLLQNQTAACEDIVAEGGGRQVTSACTVRLGSP